MAGYDTAGSGLQYFVENTEALQIGTNRLYNFTITAGVRDEDSVGNRILQVFFRIFCVGQNDRTQLTTIFFGGIHGAVFDYDPGMKL